MRCYWLNKFTSTETLNKRFNGCETDVLAVGSVGKIFDKGIQCISCEANLCEGRLFDFVEGVGKVIFDFNGGWGFLTPFGAPSHYLKF